MLLYIIFLRTAKKKKKKNNITLTLLRCLIAFSLLISVIGLCYNYLTPSWDFELYLPKGFPMECNR